MKYWVIYVQHSNTRMNEVSRILFDTKEKAIEVAKQLKGIVINGEFVEIPKSMNAS